MTDKDIRTTLREVAPLADLIILTKAAESERAASPEQLEAMLSAALWKKPATRPQFRQHWLRPAHLPLRMILSAFQARSIWLVRPANYCLEN